ncbi:hypothetical protein CPB83DRAFT_846882 [Crepidotus variabilis]|uniref:Uncharacterized protein n=1 Tax=Crepidotus variabilis TaxID=179855 RepID=A0A9P6EML7_9AGAR|nr:hypothetical protein CPB83DRAFT_846882 [Crepidotus variabilis]
MTREHNSLSGATVPISSRITALDKAGAPLTELFDYIPNDEQDWIYDPNQWNNTWKPKCAYEVHEVAQLHVYPSNSSAYQDQIPSLGAYVPTWATIYPDRQDVDTAGFYEGKLVNGSGNWRDLLVTYIFVSWPGSDPLNGNNVPSTANISFVNFLAHHVGRDASSGWFEETAFKSDVHVVDCAYTNTVKGGVAVEDQATIPASGPSSAITSVVGIYTLSIVGSSIREEPVKQPTGQEIIRYFQAYASVKYSQYPHTKRRSLLAKREVVQI